MRLFKEKPKNPKAAEKNISTTNNFQILADDFFEKVFSHIFQRLIQTLKSRKTFKDAKKNVQKN